MQEILSLYRRFTYILGIISRESRVEQATHSSEMIQVLELGPEREIPFKPVLQTALLSIGTNSYYRVTGLNPLFNGNYFFQGQQHCHFGSPQTDGGGSLNYTWDNFLFLVLQFGLICPCERGDANMAALLYFENIIYQVHFSRPI